MASSSEKSATFWLHEGPGEETDDFGEGASQHPNLCQDDSVANSVLPLPLLISVSSSHIREASLGRVSSLGQLRKSDYPTLRQEPPQEPRISREVSCRDGWNNLRTLIESIAARLTNRQTIHPGGGLISTLPSRESLSKRIDAGLRTMQCPWNQ